MRTDTDAALRSTYELPPSPTELPAPEPAAQEGGAGVRDALLVDHVLWFVRLRWLAIVALFLLGGIGLAGREWLGRLGLRAPIGWPFFAGTLLLVANAGFLVHARRSQQRRAAPNLWAQIVVDLTILTMVVYFLGSIETPTAFLYLAHIVLACIFFPRRQSLVVLVIASALYVGCVGLGRLVVTAPGIYRDPALRQGMSDHPTFAWLSVLSALGIFFVVWFLASHLSELVQGREAELAEANRRLLIAQQDKARHMLRTTHELKAPFAAIAANAQLLLRGTCGPLPDEAAAVVRRIAARCRRLAVEIQEMLQLANLQSADEQPAAVRLDVAEVVRWAIARVGATAQERRVALDERLEAAEVVAVEDHLKMLVTNIIANAVVYSREGGIVRVQCRQEPPAGPVVTVEDEGIGISAEKLPRIFDDYYRTEEAVRHNRDSTGLGLAIVRHVARSHGIRIQVESAPGCGTTFTLRFPPGT